MKENLRLESLNDQDILAGAEMWAGKERNATSNVIEYIREVNRRKLYSDLKLPSLHKYCTKVLKYSDGAAQRRIQALQLTEVLPEMKEKIESGDINLSIASRMQSYFHQEDRAKHESGEASMTLEAKREIAREVLGKTCFEAERVFLSHSVEPERHQPEKVRPVSQTHCRIEFTVSDEDRALFEKARGLLAHVQPCPSWNELFVLMAKEVIAKRDPLAKTQRKASSKKQDENPRRNASPMRSETPPEKRSATAEVKREVLSKSDSKCVNCGTGYAVQNDHLEEWALGGLTRAENLQSLCRSCNQRKAIRRFGIEKIEKEIKASRLK